MTFIGGLNQFYAIANLTLSQHFLEKKKKEKMHLISPTNTKTHLSILNSKIQVQYLKLDGMDRDECCAHSNILTTTGLRIQPC